MKSNLFGYGIGTAFLLVVFATVDAESPTAGAKVHCVDKLHATVENGVTNTWVYDSEGRVIAIVGSKGRNRTFRYDLESGPKTVTEEYSGPGSSFSKVYLLGKHGLAKSDDAGVIYEYDPHRYLVRAIHPSYPSFMETRTIVGGNLASFTQTGPYSDTRTYTYTSLDNCLDSGLYFLGERLRNWPATVTSSRDGVPLAYITYSYELDSVGRVATRTAIVRINSQVSEFVTNFSYE